MNTSNDNITLFGKILTVRGEALRIGSPFPRFALTTPEMGEITSSDFTGKVVIISVVPSLDTPLCSAQTRRFNQEAAALGEDVRILTVSLDLPFAQKRWCGAEGVTQVQLGSDYKHRSFGEATGTFVEESALLARAVFVIDKAGIVRHVEYVPDISSEPNYDAALAAAMKLLS